MNITKKNVLQTLKPRKMDINDLMNEMGLSGDRHQSVLRATLYRLISGGKVVLNAWGYFEVIDEN